MLIDRSYFNGEINIPNVDKDIIGEPLDAFIRKYETQLLSDILGYSFYQEFKTGLDAVAPDQIWIDLRDGKSYTDYNNRSQRWRGMVVTDGDDKYSFIANFVYYHFMRDNYTHTSTLGETKPKVENSDRSTPGWKMERAWNEMSDWIGELNHFLRSNKTVYTGWSEPYRYYSKYCRINTFNI